MLWASTPGVRATLPLGAPSADRRCLADYDTASRLSLYLSKVNNPLSGLPVKLAD
jgi:hypothetical protein